jgi:iron complex transport system ATP-binding protein
MQDQNILEISNINFNYREKGILNDVSFSVKNGEICGLLGPNGSGKTTLLKCINGILKSRTGNILILGRDISGLSREEIAGLIAVVPQELNVVFAFTVLQIVLMSGNGRFGFSGIAKKKDYMDACDVLSELSIGHLADRRYNELSGGEKQMVLIARALFQKPKILLLDEPTSHLDFKRQYTIMELVKKITKEKNLTTVITLHDPNIAGRYCSRLIMLKNGKIINQGLRSNIFHAESLESMYDMKVLIENTVAGTEFVLPHHKQ